MKYIDTFLSVVVALASLFLPKKWKKLSPPCCPYPYPVCPPPTSGKEEEVETE